MHVAYFPANVLIFLVTGPGYFREGMEGMLRSKNGWVILCLLAYVVQENISSWSSLCLIPVFWLACIDWSLEVCKMLVFCVCLGVFLCLWKSKVHSQKSISQIITLARYTSKGRDSPSLRRDKWSSSCVCCVCLCPCSFGVCTVSSSVARSPRDDCQSWGWISNYLWGRSALAQCSVAREETSWRCSHCVWYVVIILKYWFRNVRN